MALFYSFATFCGAWLTRRQLVLTSASVAICCDVLLGRRYIKIIRPHTDKWLERAGPPRPIGRVLKLSGILDHTWRMDNSCFLFSVFYDTLTSQRQLTTRDNKHLD